MMNLELFDKIPFFESFNEDQLQRIFPLTERRVYPSGVVIRSQGDVNFELCFLLQGSVDVQVDNQFVVTINEFGEIFGEMSIAQHTTSTATVMAKTDCTMLVLNFQELQQSLIGLEREAVLKNFYKASSEILAKKLIRTNQIAKTFKA